MGRPLHADGGRTRQAILDAALALFAEKGYFGTSLRDIAQAVGVSESALYNYFSGKDALFSALITAADEEKADRFANLFKEPLTDVRQLLEQVTLTALETFSAPRQQRLFRVLMTDGMRLAKEGRINLIERMTTGSTRLQQLMKRLVAEGGLCSRHPELLALEFLGPLLLWRHRLAIQPHGHLLMSRKAFARAHVDQFLHGASAPALRARRSTTPATAARHRPRLRAVV